MTYDLKFIYQSLCLAARYSRRPLDEVRLQVVGGVAFVAAGDGCTPTPETKRTSTSPFLVWMRLPATLDVLRVSPLDIWGASVVWAANNALRARVPRLTARARPAE